MRWQKAYTAIVWFGPFFCFYYINAIFPGKFAFCEVHLGTLWIWETIPPNDLDYTRWVNFPWKVLNMRSFCINTKRQVSKEKRQVSEENWTTWFNIPYISLYCPSGALNLKRLLGWGNTREGAVLGSGVIRKIRILHIKVITIFSFLHTVWWIEWSFLPSTT